MPGNKKDNVTVIYTPWSNLKKDGSMAVGQVGFKDPKKVFEPFKDTFCIRSFFNLPIFCFPTLSLLPEESYNA